MKENRDMHHIYVTVDPTKIARCKWCGAIESQEWQSSGSGLYCSKECSQASIAGEMLQAFLVMLIGAPILALLSGTSSPSTFILVWLIFSLLSVPLLFCGALGYRYSSRIPRNSRVDRVLSKRALLRALTSPVVCPRCDANLDLNKIDDDNVFTCGYCGATGDIKILATGPS